MKILFAASEAVPFAKTGGLGDVAGALPRALAELGQKVVLVMPCYRCCQRPTLAKTNLTVEVPILHKRVAGAVYHGRLPDSNVDVYLIDQPNYYDRPDLYGPDGGSYSDNCERFVFFSRAVMQVASLLPVEWDIIHANDWQTGLVPVYLREMYRHRPGLTQARSLLTIHNIAYQGIFWHWDMKLTGLDWRLFHWRRLEFYGNLNLLKGGIAFADAISTVSPRYAEEIQSPEQGHGLDSLDYRVWNPATDGFIAQRYDVETVVEGKRACKSQLQRSNNLPVRDDVPLLCMITRLASQKGIELLLAVADRLLARDVQFILLGTGETRYRRMLAELSDRYRDKAVFLDTFNEVLAHRIQAGADLILIPSRYEPCGLTQLIALRYGTVPVVRATGGLADTIVDCTDTSLMAGTANGFSFSAYTPEVFWQCLERALQMWKRREDWHKLVRTGMGQDWSWQRSARQYLELYEQVRSDRWPRPEEFY